MSDTGDEDLIERLARAACEAEGMDPDALVHVDREEAELCADAAAFDIAEKAAQTCKHNPGCECEWNDDGEVQICQPMYEFALIRIYKHTLKEREIIRKASRLKTRRQRKSSKHHHKALISILRGI